MRLSILLTLLLSLFFVTPAWSAEKQSFRSYTNQLTCKQLVDNLETPRGVNDLALLVSAFVTGSNYAKSRDSQLDLKSMMILTERYCRQNPDWSATTVFIVLDQAIEKRFQVESKK